MLRQHVVPEITTDVPLAGVLSGTSCYISLARVTAYM